MTLARLPGPHAPRRRALRGLAVLLLLAGALPADATEPTAVWVDPVLRPLEVWLRGDDPILRGIAAFELRRQDREGALALAVGALGREQDVVVLGCALASLEGRARVDLVAEGGSLLPGLLLTLARHEHPVLRDRARGLLRTLTGPEADLDEDGLRRWWLRTRSGLETEQLRLLTARAEARGRTRPADHAPDPAEGRTTPGDAPPDLYDYVARLRKDGLEALIVLDHTGSMAPVIGAARRRAASLVARLAWLVPRFRAGLVTYDDAARLRIPLTVDGEALQAAFGKVVATGGGDWQEGVDKGIRLALRQEQVGWSRSAWRVIVVIGDAPPHAHDVNALLRRIRKARADELYDHPVVIHAVSTSTSDVDHFRAIATTGGGTHRTLGDVGQLEEALVGLAFGAAFQDRVAPWLAEVEALRRATPRR